MITALYTKKKYKIHQKQISLSHDGAPVIVQPRDKRDIN